MCFLFSFSQYHNNGLHNLMVKLELQTSFVKSIEWLERGNAAKKL